MSNLLNVSKKEMDKWNANPELKAKFPERDKMKIKASGGIKTIEAAENFKALGVDRLGCSKLF